jgi:hypothetical protein
MDVDIDDEGAVGLLDVDVAVCFQRAHLDQLLLFRIGRIRAEQAEQRAEMPLDSVRPPNSGSCRDWCP